MPTYNPGYETFYGQIKKLSEFPGGRSVGLEQNIEQLLSLARFQVPEGIVLSHTVSPPELRCRLPESGFRHALFNLVLNAAQAIGDVARHHRHLGAKRR